MITTWDIIVMFWPVWLVIAVMACGFLNNHLSEWYKRRSIEATARRVATFRKLEGWKQ